MWHRAGMPKIAFVVCVACLLAPGVIDVPASGQARRRNAVPGLRAEKAATAALARARVPLQEDSAGRVRWIEAPRGEVNDAALVQIAQLRALEWLELAGTHVTPKGVARLKECRTLKRLYLHDVDLSGHDPTWLSALVRLESLSLRHTGI